MNSGRPTPSLALAFGAAAPLAAPPGGLRRPARLTAFAFICTMIAVAPFPTIAVSSDEPEKVDSVRKLIDESVDYLALSKTAVEGAPMEARSVLRWDNNTRGSKNGLTVLYLDDGRPYAVACLYPWEGRINLELGSLSRGRPVARREGEAVWEPKEAGVEFKPVPKTAAPAERRAQRLRQLKQIVRRFDATLVGWKTDDSDRQKLRLLPSPLYRYEKASGAVVDGAVFAFVMGTDPEVLLMLEAVETDGKVEWQYAFTRRTSGALEGALDDKTVWSVKRNYEPRDPKGTFFTYKGMRVVEEVESSRESRQQTADSR